MIPLLLIILPAAAAGILLICRRSFKAAVLLPPAVALLETALTILLLLNPGPFLEQPPCPQWLACDETGKIFLAVTSLLFLAVTCHTALWLPAEQKHGEGGELQRPAVFSCCLMGFLATMMLVILARNFGLLWVAVEATTLISAPLIIFHRGPRPIEAMWKYLLICSVGIGLALFGTMLLAVSAGSTGAALDMSKMQALKASLEPRWHRAAFIFLLAGYGTKMGLAPFHTWLPDAHSEAPGVVSALLSGALLNCSLLAILRVLATAPATEAAFNSGLLTALGLISLVTAAFFTIRQHDFKRMLAYSSVEHMGLLALFIGVGAHQLSLIHLCGHSLLKMALFLLAGNFLLGCGTRRIPLLGGLLRQLPRNSVLWIAGIILVCGMPPSPLFYTEFQLLMHLSVPLAAVTAALLLIIFAAMTMAVLKMTMGEPGEVIPEPEKARAAEKLWLIPAAALLLTALAGTYLLTQLTGGLLK